MDLRKNKRKRENPIKIENMKEYLKELGVFDELLRSEKLEFNDLMDDILLTNKQKTEVRKIRRLFKNREYVRIRRNQHKKDLIEFNDKMTELKNEIKLYKEKNNELETKNKLYEKKIDKLEVKNSLLEIRVDLKQENNEEPFDFNSHFNL